MKRFLAALLTAKFLMLTTVQYAFAQTAMDFVDDPDNPRFYSGGTMWTLVSIFLMLTFGALTRNPWITAIVGIVPLALAIARGDFSPIVLVMLVAIAASCTLIYILFRR